MHFKPKSGIRVNIYSNDEVLVYVRTVRKENEFSHKNVQQSDYIYLWDNKSSEESKTYFRLKEFICKNDLIYKIALNIYGQHYRSVNSLSKHNPNLMRVNVDHLLLM